MERDLLCLRDIGRSHGIGRRRWEIDQSRSVGHGVGVLEGSVVGVLLRGAALPKSFRGSLGGRGVKDCSLVGASSS